MRAATRRLAFPARARGRVLAAAACVLAAGIAATLALTKRADATAATPFAANFAVFSEPVPVLRGVPMTEVTGSGPEPTSAVRILGENLGPYSLKLVAFTVNREGVCFALVGWTSYCWRPDVVPGHKHFHPSALYSFLNGQSRVQLHGLAFDDVEALEVRVRGQWRNVPLANNGFYLDLPGVEDADVDVVRATLSDGSVQTYNLHTGF